MNVTLHDRLQERIAQRVQAGDYESAEQLVHDAVERLLANDAEELEEMREKLAHADEQIAHGAYTDYNEHTIMQLAERVKTAGRRSLAADKKTGTR